MTAFMIIIIIIIINKELNYYYYFNCKWVFIMRQWYYKKITHFRQVAGLLVNNELYRIWKEEILR
jgi:hypothetical protein